MPGVVGLGERLIFHTGLEGRGGYGWGGDCRVGMHWDGLGWAGLGWGAC